MKALIVSVILTLCGGIAAGQLPQPTPGTPRSAVLPAIKEAKLKNGLLVAAVEKKSVPLVTVTILIGAGAAIEDEKKAGLADLTASMLTKGTKTRSATQIAEQIEFLGGTISSGAGWNAANVTVTVPSDKLESALKVMSDIILDPAFEQKELDLLKSQTADELSYNLNQPSFLANYAASVFTFNEHPVVGTPETIRSITPEDLKAFYAANYLAKNSRLIFAGDVSAANAEALATRYFGKMAGQNGAGKPTERPAAASASHEIPMAQRLLVIDLPNSGQAAVSFTNRSLALQRSSPEYYVASVYNSVLGGGYSSRLNQEIRIKRGLSYGAGSSFSWRGIGANFATRTQTKNESAAEVAQLVVEELQKLMAEPVSEGELIPRKAVLTGNFGRNMETTAGIAGFLADLYTFGVPVTAMNEFDGGINGVSAAKIEQFAKTNVAGDLIIVGDYAKFKEDLAKRFPKLTAKVVTAEDLRSDIGSLTK